MPIKNAIKIIISFELRSYSIFMNIVQLHYISLQSKDDLSQISEQLVSHWLTELSEDKKEAIQRLLNNNDRLASLIATRLLKTCVESVGVKNFQLNEVLYPDNGKPAWKSNNRFLDFNISHSNKIIGVAVSTTIKVGLDIEKIRPLKSLNFKMVLSAEELSEIEETPDQFFNLWSKKEAVVKAADTVGIGRMRDVVLQDSQAALDKQIWFLKKIDLDSKYSTYLATSKKIDEVVIKKVLLSDFYS